MSTLILTRGLPGSGKTTEAMARLAATPGGVRLNRDALREALYDRAGVLDHAVETSITTIQQAAARQALAAGSDVIVDDCNLRARYCREWADLAATCGADVDVIDLTGIPLETCIERDLARGLDGGRFVGEAVIKGMHLRYLAAGRLAPVRRSEPRPAAGEGAYWPDMSLPPTWLVDMDGTLALGHFGKPGRRGPFDWGRVGEDDANVPVVRLVRALSVCYQIVVMSGRSDACRAETAAWLADADVYPRALLMRKDGDRRPDHVVKAELFDAHVRDAYAVIGVLDDRDSVVEMWRGMGLMCAQVAPGAF